MADRDQDAVALVTGGSRGLGRAIAQRLAADGMKVAVAARSRDQLDSLVQEIVGAGGAAFAVACDVTRHEDVKHAVEKTRRVFGPVTLLVNNAGVAGPSGPIGTVDPHAWWETQTVHVFGALLFMSEVIPQMVEKGGGRIINVCSQAGTFVTPNYSSYSLAKCSLIRLTEHVDAERRDQNIKAFPIQPGTIITDLAKSALASENARKWMAPLVELLESVSPEDSARSMAKMQDFVSDLARGRWDNLSGRYLDIDWDLEALAREASDA